MVEPVPGPGRSGLEFVVEPVPRPGRSGLQFVVEPVPRPGRSGLQFLVMISALLVGASTVQERGKARSHAVPGLIAVALALAVGLSVRAQFGTPAIWALPVLAASVGLSEIAVVHFNNGRQRWTLSCTDAVLSLVFALNPGSWLVLAVPAGVALAQLTRRQTATKTLFNIAQFAAATAAGALAATVAAQAALPRLSVAAAAMTAFWLTQTGLVAAVVAATTRRSLHRVLLVNAPLALVHTAASASVGLLAAWLTLNAPAGLLGLLVPVVLLWSSFDQSSHRAAEARLFAELARGQEEAGGGSVDVSAQVVLTAAARLLGGADVEMLLFAGDGLVRYQGNERGVPLQQRVGVDAMDAPWIPEVLAGGVVLGLEAGRPYCGLRVGPAERPLALLLASRDVGTGVFNRRDARLGRVLVGQAEAWLAVADLAASRDAALDRVAAAGQHARALGDLGADTAPALAVLRESAGRLARLAQRGDPRGDLRTDPSGENAAVVAGIIDELHTVERAVASVLGAIALAADPDLALDSVSLDDVTVASDGAREPDWTSSGVLR